jgi:hypothetical protein
LALKQKSKGKLKELNASYDYNFFLLAI